MGGLFKTSTVSTTEPRISSFQVTQSSYGVPIPIVFGTTRISGTMLDYDDFTAIAHTTTTRSGGKGGGGVKSKQTTYTYTVAAAIALAEGPCTNVGKIWASKAIGDLDSNQMTFFDGSVGQSPWGYMVSKHPSKAIGYSGVAYVAGVLDLGSSASLPNYNFEVYGLCQDKQGQSISYVSNYNNVLQVVSCKPNAPVETWTIGGTNIKVDSVREFLQYLISGKFPVGVVGSISGETKNAIPDEYYDNGKIQFILPSELPETLTWPITITVSSTNPVPNSTNLCFQCAYQKEIEISNFVSNTSVQEYVYGQGWIILDSRYYTITQKKDSYGNNIPNVYIYKFNFDDRTDGYDRVDPLRIRINYVATSASVQYTPKDANPRDIIYELMANERFGCQFPTAYIDDWSDYSNYCKTNSLLLSLAITSQQQASEIISNILEATNSDMVWSQGKAKIVPYYDGLTPIYDIADDNIINQENNTIVITRNPQADRYNVVPLEFLDRANDYNTDTVYATDQGDIDLHGIRQMSTKSHHEIMDKSVAQAVAQMILQKQLYVRNQYVVKLGQEFVLLDPMDAVTLACESAGLDTTTVRVVSIRESKEDYSLEFTFEDNPTGAMSAPVYEIQNATRNSIDFNIDPGNVNTPVIFEPAGELTSTGFETWIAANGGSNWGGAIIWVSEDNTTYKSVGSITNPARYGTLVNDVTANDTSITIQLNDTSQQLSSGTEQDAQNLRTACWVDGEIIAYTTATLVAPGKYTLTGLIRGACNTAASAHSAGSSFVRLDDAIYKYQFDKDMIGKTIYVKLTSVNIYGAGEQSIADVTAIPHTITVQYPPNVSNVTLDEDTFILKDGTALTDIIANFTTPTYSIFDHYNVYYDVNNSGQWQYHGQAIAGGYKIKGLPNTKTVKVKVTTVNKFGVESAGAVSSPYTIVGKSNPPPDVTELSLAQDEYNRAKIVLTWTPIDLTTVPDLKGYEVRLGNTWNSGIKLNTDVVVGNTFSYAVSANGNYTFMVKAIDNSGNYSVNAVTANIIVIVVPDTPTNFTVTQDPKDRSIAVLSWNATPGKDIAEYQISVNGQTLTTKELIYRYTLPNSGTYEFSLRAKTVAGYYSNSASASITATIEPYDVTGFTAVQSISDRTKVTLMWDNPISQDVSYFIIKKGVLWDSGIVIASRATGTFFETIVNEETEQTFWIKAVSIAGKESQYPVSTSGIFNMNPSPVSNIQIAQQANDKSILLITWDGVSESDLVGYQVAIGNTWETAEKLPLTQELKTTYNLTSTGDIKVMIKTVNAAGYYSDEVFESYYAILEPLDVTNFTAIQNGEYVEMYWDKATESDVVAYEIREGANFDSGSLVASGVTLTEYKVKVDNERQYYYHIKAINRSLHYSLNAASAMVTVQNLPPKNVIQSYDEIALQSGTHNNTEFGQSLINWQTIGGKWSDYPNTKFSDVGGQTVLKLKRTEADPTFTRASVAYKSDGTQVAANVPRIDGGIMVEEGTTNYVISPKTQNNIVSPSSGYTQYNYNHNHPYGGVPQSQAVTYAVSFELKQRGTYPFGSVVLGGGAGGDDWNIRIRRDLTLQGTGVSGSVTTKSLADGWKRYECVFTIPTTGYLQTFVKFITEYGTGAVDSDIRNVQLEAKPYATSFVDGTRSPERLTIPTVGVLSPQEGTIEFKLNLLNLHNCNNILGGSLPSSKRWLLFCNANGTLCWDWGVVNDAIIATSALSVGQQVYFALRWKDNIREMFVNGVCIGSKSYNPADGIPSSFGFGVYSPDSDCIISDLRISSRARTDTEIAEAYTNGVTIDDDTTYFAPFTNNALSVPLYRNKDGTYTCVRKDMGQVITANITTDFRSSVILRGTGSAKLQIRISKDNITWTDWQDFRPAQYTFRYADFRVLLSTEDVTKTPEVNHCTIYIDVPDTQKRGSVTIPVGGTTVNYCHTYYTVPIITPTAIGDNKFPQVTAKTNSNFTVKIVDRTGNDVGGQLDWTATGY